MKWQLAAFCGASALSIVLWENRLHISVLLLETHPKTQLSFAEFPFYKQTNVHSNIVSVRLFLQKVHLNVHWFACLSV